MTTFSGSEAAPRRRRITSVRSQPTTKTPPAPRPGGAHAERREARDDRQEAGQQEDLDEDLRRRPDDLDFAGPREKARALRVLLEQAPHLDRREPVERERERLEEQEASRSRPREPASRIMRVSCEPEPPPQARLERVHLRRRRSRGRSPSRCRKPWTRSRSISRADRLAAAPRLPRGVGNRDHDVAEKRARRARRRETRGRRSSGPCAGSAG